MLFIRIVPRAARRAVHRKRARGADASSTTLTRLRRIRVARCGDYGRASSFSVTVSRPGRQDGLRPRCAASRPSRHLCRPAPAAGRCPASGAGRPACSGRFGPDSLSVPPSCPGAGCGSEKRLHPLHYRHRHGRSPPRTPSGYGLVKRHHIALSARYSTPLLLYLIGVYWFFLHVYCCGRSSIDVVIFM